MASSKEYFLFLELEKFGIWEEDMRMLNKKITIRPEEHKDYKSIVSLILRSFQEGTDYSDGTDIIFCIICCYFIII